MATAVGEREALTYIKEVTLGTLPGTPTMTPLWHNTESLNPVRQSFESGRSLGDHQVADFRLGRKSGQGDVVSELVYANFDDMFEGLLRTDIEAAPFTAISAATISFTAPDTIDDSGSGLTDVAIGDYIFVSGAADGNNNGLFKILTASAGSCTTEEQTITTAAASPTITIRQCDFVNGVETPSWSLQKHYQDINSADHYLGSVITSGALNVPANGIAQMTWGWMCQKFLADQTPETTLASVTEYRPFDGLSGVYNEAGIASQVMTAFSANIDHSVEFTEPLGTDIGGEVIYRKTRVSGQVSFYYNSPDMAGKFWDETITSLVTSLVDPAGNTYVIGFPRVVLTSVSRPKSDDGPIIDQFNWTALRSEGGEKTVFVVKIAA